MGFLKFVAIVLIVYYGIKWLAKHVLPILLKKIMEKNGMHFQDFNSKPESKDEEGNVKVHSKPKETKRFEGGEYVDFEEIKDN